MSDLNGAAYDSSTIVNLQQILKELVLLFLVLIESSFLQADHFTHSTAEIHHSVSGVSPLQGLIAPGQPEQGQCETASFTPSKYTKQMQIKSPFTDLA